MARVRSNRQKSPVCVQKSHAAEKTHVVAREKRHGACADLQLKLLLCVTARLERWESPNLAAPYWRLYVMSGPGARAVWNGRMYELDAKHAWLVAPDTAFAAGLAAPVEQTYVHFTLASGVTAARGVYGVPVARELRRTLARAKSERASARGGILWSQLVLMALDGLPGGVVSAHEADPRVARVQAHLERAPGAAHTLETLARVAGMHARALIRLFRQETGDTPMAWLRARRIALACELLHHSDRKIDDIATTVGFCDRYQFTKTFKRLREISPGAFRASQRALG